MRLTLRTLLAYLDDVLDPADKEELSRKIETSDFAEDLVHRTRDTMRRLRLSAPQVIGSGMGLDPNSVAEYLDNVLPPEQVGDFERICLESDVHLAEAAACHHVLTMVLGEPADVDPRARQRMYGVPAEARERKQLRAEPAHRAAVAAAAAAVPSEAATPAAATTPISHQPTEAMELPEYLRTRSWWQSRGVLAGLAMVLLVGTALYLASGLTGWFGGREPMTALTLNEQPIAPAPAPEAPAHSATEEGAGESLDSGNDAVRAPQDSSADPSAASPSLGSPPRPLMPGIAPQPQDEPIASQEVVPERDAEAPSADADTSEAAIAPAEPASAAPDQSEAPPAARPYEIPPTAAPTTTDPPMAEEVAAEEPRANVAPPEDVPLVAAIPDEPVAGSVDPAPAPAATAPEGQPIAASEIAPDAASSDDFPAGPPELGTYLGGKTVLVRWDDESGSWFRVEPRAAVVAGQRLLSLPEFRPKITLISGVHLDISGGTQIVLNTEEETARDAGLRQTAAGVPRIEVIYGRVILINTSMAENRVRLKLGPHVGEAQMSRNATLAVEVERQYVPGHDPRLAPSPVVVRLFAPDGVVTWRDEAGEKLADGPSRWTIAGGEMSEIVADDSPPEWIDQEPAVHLSEQRFGAPVVENTLISNRPVDIQLLELFQGRARREVKSLVARSSIHVGLFEPFIDALRDSEQRPNWASHIQALRSAMALSPESAESVRQALLAQRGERAAADLYEMLCGYSVEQVGLTPEEVKTGALARLIDWLEEDSLDYRVLAVHNLAELTGKWLMPNPAANLAERTKNVRRWRSRLDSGELRAVAEQD